MLIRKEEALTSEAFREARVTRSNSSRRSLPARLMGGSEPFILTAMISLIGGSIWMFRERELLLGHFYRPEMLSITHTITLGWISMLMIPTPA